MREARAGASCRYVGGANLSEIADADVIDSSHNSCAVEYLPLAAASRSHKGTRIGRILLLLFVFCFDYPQSQGFGVLRLILDIRLSFPFALSFSLLLL
jgi:hypothetical protein